MNPYPFASLNHFTVPVAIPVLPFASGSLRGGLSDETAIARIGTRPIPIQVRKGTGNCARVDESPLPPVRRLRLFPLAGLYRGLGVAQGPGARGVAGEQGGFLGAERGG